MASRFDVKFSNFVKSVDGLKSNINGNNKDLNAKKAILYDFSGSIEQGWKLVKYYLEHIEGFEDLGNASKKVIRAGCQDGLYDETMTEELLKMIDLRNILMHEYNYNAIEESCEKINEYIGTIDKLYKVLAELRIKYQNYWEQDSINI